MALGPVRGGAVKLTPHKDVTSALAVGEGIESVLSISRQAPSFGHTPTWSLLSEGGVAPDRVREHAEAMGRTLSAHERWRAAEAGRMEQAIAELGRVARALAAREGA